MIQSPQIKTEDQPKNTQIQIKYEPKDNQIQREDQPKDHQIRREDQTRGKNKEQKQKQILGIRHAGGLNS